jgi:hypothetical protein
MKILVRLLIFSLVIGLMVYFYAGLNRSAPVKPTIEQKRPNLAAISPLATTSSGSIALAQSAAQPLTPRESGSAHRSATLAVQTGS